MTASLPPIADEEAFYPARGDRLRKTLHPVAEFNVRDIFSTKGLSSSGSTRSNTCNIRMRKNIASVSANSSVEQKPSSASLRKLVQRRGRGEEGENGDSLTPDTEPRSTPKRYECPTRPQTLLPPLRPEFVCIFAVDVFPSMHRIHVNVDIRAFRDHDGRLFFVTATR